MSEPGPEPAAEAGIHCLRIPTPFMVGRVNTYLIEDDPLTLVDCGPNSGKALDELERALAGHGHRIEDLGLLIITHQHIDHVGLASILARRSGAEVAALDRLAPFLERYGEDMERDDEFAAQLMLRHGIPEDLVVALRSVSASFRAWGASANVTRPLADGGELALRDRTLQVLHRPGHSPSDTVFFDPERSILLAGDHLIKHVSSNPLITRPLDGAQALPDPAGASRPRALQTYLRSLRATREMEIDLVLSGHGEPITDHVTVIDERFRLHQRRAERILRLIDERSSTAYEIAQRLWGNVAVTQAFLTLSEVLGHVDLLLDEGRVREIDEHGVIRFAAVPGDGART